jgi:hypothetical protein
MPNQAAFIDMFHHLGLNLDPWQGEVIEARHRRLLLNCSRQAGKSTVAAILSLQEVILFGGTMVLLLSRSQRQSASRLSLENAQRVWRCPPAEVRSLPCPEPE